MKILSPVFITLLIAISILLFSISLLTIFRPPTNFFWKLSILVQEGGHWFSLGCLSLAGMAGYFAFSSSKVLKYFNIPMESLGKVMLALLFVAGIFFTTPLVRAIICAYRLEAAFVANFGTKALNNFKPNRVKPIQWKDLFLGIKLPELKPLTFHFPSSDSFELAIDYYRAIKPMAPCILVIHGGGWDSGDRQDLEPMNRYLTSLGYSVATVDYRLAPKFKYPAPVIDVKAAITFLEENSERLGIDANRFIILGRSAGGQIALQVAYDPSLSNRVKGVVSYYAPADMVFGYSLPCHPLILDSRKLMENYLNGSYSENPKAYLASSPIESLRAESPATLLLHGHVDMLVDYEHSVRMETKLTKLSVSHFTVDLPWATHGFDYVFSGPGSQIGLFFLERFLAQVTR